MTYASEPGAGRTGGEHGRSSESATPGKSTLTGAMSGLAVQRRTDGGAAAATPGPGKSTLTGAISGPAATTREFGRRNVEPQSAHGAGSGRDVNGSAAPGAARPAPGAGAAAAATVMASTAENELAHDGLFTPALIADLHANPQMSIEDVLQRIASTGLRGKWGNHVVHHPTIVQVGRMPRTAPGARTGKKRAVMIANEHYAHMGELGQPKKEADGMQAELAGRGYEARVHQDKTAAEMGALWGTLVGTANRGDQLVAHYGGHGLPEGLAGIDHDRPPNPPAVFRNEQVAGVVSAATDKGAQIRFVTDSCHSGNVVDAVREERHNKLAEATGAGSVGDELRIATMTGLRQAKQRLLESHGLVHAIGKVRAAAQRSAAAGPTGKPSDKPSGKAGGSTPPAAARDVDVDDVPIPPGYSLIEGVWGEFAPLLEVAGMIVRPADAPPPLDPHAPLGAQLNHLDDLWNALSRPMEDAIGKSADARRPA